MPEKMDSCLTDLDRIAIEGADNSVASATKGEVSKREH